MADNPNTIRGWPGGMNNVLPDYDLAANADTGKQNTLRNIVNADVLPSGRLKRRNGITQRIAGNVHSFHKGYAVVDGVLSKIAADYSLTALATMTSTERVYYTEIGGIIYYSNGVDKGRIIGGENKHWGVEAPALAPSMAAMVGALPPGRYMSIVTFIDEYGEESGCGRSAAIELTATGGIALTIPQPTAAHVAGIRVYFTGTNDDVLYSIGDLDVGTTALNVLVMPTFGMTLETQFLQPFLPTELIVENNGRIYGVTGNILWHTQPLRYGTFKPSSDFMIYPAPITIVAPVSGGMYVVADKTYWLAGNSPEDFTTSTVLDYTAAKGSLSALPKSDEKIWFSSAGIVRAGAGGDVKLIQEPNIRTADSAVGATLYVEQSSIKKVIAQVSGEPFATGLSSMDYMDAEVERARR